MRSRRIYQLYNEREVQAYYGPGCSNHHILLFHIFVKQQGSDVIHGVIEEDDVANEDDAKTVQEVFDTLIEKAETVQEVFDTLIGKAVEELLKGD